MQQKLTIRRHLPRQAEILVQPGQKVDDQDIIGQLNSIPGRMIRCNVAFELGCEAADVWQSMTKQRGEWINKEEPLVVTDAYFTKRSCKSPVSGHIVLVSKILGSIFIREALQSTDAEVKQSVLRKIAQPESASEAASGGADAMDRGIFFSHDVVASFLAASLAKAKQVMPQQARVFRAHLDGVVRQISEDEVIIDGYGFRFQGIIGFGQEQNGILLPLKSQDADLSAAEVAHDLHDRIVMVRRGVTLQALRSLEQAGAVGLIAGSIQPSILREFSQQEPLQIMGHRMHLPFTIILMQGFSGSMSEKRYLELASLAGKRAAIDGKTQLRAGMIRPEILFANQTAAPDAIYEEAPAENRSLQPGDRVVIVRQPHFGKSAVVVALTAEQDAAVAGAKIALLAVRLESGEEIKLPLQNCQKV